MQVNPGFVRLIVSDGDERTELDLAADARLFPAEPGRLAPTLTGEELAVDKVLAVFGRAEARDFADLMALEPRYGLDRLCELAAEKDLGFDAPCSPRCSAGSTGCGGTSSSSTTQSTSNFGERSTAGTSARSSVTARTSGIAALRPDRIHGRAEAK